MGCCDAEPADDKHWARLRHSLIRPTIERPGVRDSVPKQKRGCAKLGSPPHHQLHTLKTPAKTCVSEGLLEENPFPQGPRRGENGSRGISGLLVAPFLWFAPAVFGQGCRPEAWLLLGSSSLLADELWEGPACCWFCLHGDSERPRGVPRVWGLPPCEFCSGWRCFFDLWRVFAVGGQPAAPLERVEEPPPPARKQSSTLPIFNS